MDADRNRRIEVVCPRCGKARSVIERAWRAYGGVRICQPCGTALSDKRRRVGAMFAPTGETIDENLAEIEKTFFNR